MPKYHVSVAKKAQKFLDNLNSKERSRVIVHLKGLADYPFFDNSLDIIKLRGEENFYRIRIGKIRVIFEVEKQSASILMRKISYRESAYE